MSATLAMMGTDRDEAHQTERPLVEAALRGDGLAFRRLVEPHLGMLHRVALRVGGDRGLAEDVVQETLTLAFERLGSYRHEVPFRAFLAAVAAKMAHTVARGERRRKGREQASEGPEQTADPEAQLEGAHAAARVRAALLAMPKKRREAALMRLDAGLSHREIALALGSTEGSTRVLVHKALAELEERLADLLTPTSRPLP